MNGKRWTVLAILFFFLTTSSQWFSPLHQYSVQVHGAVERDLAGGEISYESTPFGRQIFLQKVGPGQDRLVLVVILPDGERPGQYEMSDPKLASSSYYEIVGGVSRQFYKNVQGSLSIRKSGSTFSGDVDFTVDGSTGTVTIQGRFEEIPFRETKAPGSGTLFAGVFSVCFFMIFLVLLLLSLVIQFYISKRVYAGPGLSLQILLRGPQTFVLGWQDYRLYPMMILWSLVLAAAVIVLILSIVFLNPFG